MTQENIFRFLAFVFAFITPFFLLDIQKQLRESSKAKFWRFSIVYALGIMVSAYHFLFS